MKQSPKACCSHKAPAPEWMEMLRGQAGRVTQSRRIVLDALLQLQRPSTPRQIANAMGQGSCDLATVYRSMALFEKMGLVHRIDFGDGLARFEIADHDPKGHHHHHLLCRRCDRIVKLDECILAEMQSQLARHYGFAEITHRLEFFGICPDCQRVRPPSGRRRTAPP
jgi:Fur family transcriptional regulator, ferric uptake regulator